MSLQKSVRSLFLATSAALALSCTNETPVDESPGTVTSAIVPGRYIVVLKKGAVLRGVQGRAVPDKARDMASRRGGRVVRTYEYALEGFAADPGDAEQSPASRVFGDA